MMRYVLLTRADLRFELVSTDLRFVLLEEES